MRSSWWYNKKPCKWILIKGLLSHPMQRESVVWSLMNSKHAWSKWLRERYFTTRSCCVTRIKGINVWQTQGLGRTSNFTWYEWTTLQFGSTQIDKARPLELENLKTCKKGYPINLSQGKCKTKRCWKLIISSWPNSGRSEKKKNVCLT